MRGGWGGLGCMGGFTGEDRKAWATALPSHSPSACPHDPSQECWALPSALCGLGGAGRGSVSCGRSPPGCPAGRALCGWIKALKTELLSVASLACPPLPYTVFSWALTVARSMSPKQGKAGSRLGAQAEAPRLRASQFPELGRWVMLLPRRGCSFAFQSPHMGPRAARRHVPRPLHLDSHLGPMPI